MLYLILFLCLVRGVVNEDCPKASSIKNVKSIDWKFINTDETYCIGNAVCIDGYFLDGNGLVIYNKSTNPTTSYNFTCTDSKIVNYDGLHYKFYTFDINESKARKFPLVDPTISYIFVGTYNATYTHPTIRVSVSLIGRTQNPVLINVQQSTESVGFELPLRVVGRDGTELTPYMIKTVELCPPNVTKDKTNPGIPETVKVTASSNEKDSKASLQIDMTYVQHIDLNEDNDNHIIKINPSDIAIFRYRWSETDHHVDVTVSWYSGDKNDKAGSGMDVCALVSIRSGDCPLEKGGELSLTFTREGFISVNRIDEKHSSLRDGFLVVVEVLPDDYRCEGTARPKKSPSKSRTKTVEVAVKPRRRPANDAYVALPLCVSVIIVIFSACFYLCVLRPQKEKYELQVNVMEEPCCSGENQGFTDKELLVPNSKDDDMSPVELNDEDEANDGDSKNKSQLSQMLDKVKKNEMVVQLTETIGYCNVPLIVFLVLFDSVFDDMQGNLKEYNLRGNLDTCYINAKCAFPINSTFGYVIPNFSRVFSNLPYIVSGICFCALAYIKRKTMDVINKSGKGVRHDFSLLYVFGFLTAVVGIASAIYHVCPNQSTSRIDIFFIEILLAYYSLKVHQSRSPDITRLFYAPVAVVSILNVIQRVAGKNEASWITVSLVNVGFTVIVALQLFVMGEVKFNPFAFNYKGISRKVKDVKKNVGKYKKEFGAFGTVIIINLIIAALGILKQFNDYSVYNVVAFAANIVFYMGWRLLTKGMSKTEKIVRSGKLLIVLSLMSWSLALLAFWGYKTTDTTLSPAESRVYNKECFIGAIDGHDLWHCLTAMAMLFTNLMIMTMDDDLLDTPTEETIS